MRFCVYSILIFIIVLTWAMYNGVTYAANSSFTGKVYVTGFLRIASNGRIAN